MFTISETYLLYITAYHDSYCCPAHTTLCDLELKAFGMTLALVYLNELLLLLVCHFTERVVLSCQFPLQSSQSLHQNLWRNNSITLFK